jgi:hypothetical protein
MIKKTTLIISTFIVLGSTLQAQVVKNNVNANGPDPKDCVFFSGDSLSGFDLEATVREAKSSLRIYNEQKNDIFRKEVAFVKSKYKIDNLPFEKAAESRIVKPSSVLTSGCYNINFLQGNFNGWSGAEGYNPNTYNPLVLTSNTISSIGINSTETSCSYQTLVNNGTDHYGNFPVFPFAAGSFVCRLGGEFINIDAGTYTSEEGNPFTCTASNDPSGNGSSNGEMIEQTFPVSASNAVFTYNYAIVMASAPHTGNSNPYFRAQVLDSAGNVIPCLSFMVEGDTTGNGTTPPGFAVSLHQDDLGNQVLYSPWQQRSINLQAYIGHNVTIRFTASGCGYGGHFCYAYIYASCGALQLTASSSAICPGSTATSTLSAPSLNGLYNSYSWSGPGIVGASNTQSIQVNTPGTYSAVISSIGTCSFTTTLTDSISSTTIQPVSISGINSICNGATDLLTASGATNYTWSANAGSATSNTVSVNPTTNTVYTVTGTTGACLGTSTISVAINAATLVTISSNLSSDTICAGQPDILTASGATSFTWSANAGSATTNSVSITPTLSDTYTLTANDNNGCLETVTKQIYVKTCTTDINQLAGMGKQVILYPNPNNGNFTIETSKSMHCIIYNTNGGEVFNQTINGKVNIDGGNLANGIYNVSILSDAGIINKRLVIVK